MQLDAAGTLGEVLQMTHTKEDMASDQSAEELIAKLRDWPRVSLGNYGSYDGAFTSARLVAVEQRLALAREMMRRAVTTGFSRHEFNLVIAACTEPFDDE